MHKYVVIELEDGKLVKVRRICPTIDQAIDMKDTLIERNRKRAFVIEEVEEDSEEALTEKERKELEAYTDEDALPYSEDGDYVS